MDTTLTVLQWVLALLFLMAGANKAFRPIAKVAELVPAASERPGFFRFLGYAEILGAIGLVLPMQLWILPWLTVIAALALGIIMGGAVQVHAKAREHGQMVFSVVVLVLLWFIAYGRWPLMTLI